MSFVDKLIKTLHNQNISDWDRIRFRVEEEQRKSLPEIQVIEALRSYIDGVWSDPIERNNLWQGVLRALRDLDIEDVKRIERKNRYKAEALVPPELKIS